MLTFTNFTVTVPFADFSAENWEALIRDSTNPENTSQDEVEMLMLRNAHRGTTYTLKNYVDQVLNRAINYYNSALTTATLEAEYKRILQSSLGNLVWVSIIQLALRSLEPAIHSFLPSCFRYHGQYYVALLDMVVISVLICVPLATGTWTRLVQYIQLVMYSRISYLNID